MKKLNDFFEKHFIPFAVKLNNIKGLIAIRDAFIQIFPLTFVGSIAVCINCVVFNSTGFIGQLLISVIPELDKYQDILSPNGMNLRYNLRFMSFYFYPFFIIVSRISFYVV